MSYELSLPLITPKAMVGVKILYKSIGCISLVLMISSCTGFNSLYPKFSGYDGSDSAEIFVLDDSYNQSIYRATLTKEGCFDVNERRLLTRNLALKGSGKEISQYKVKAGQYYIIGVQVPRYFHYRSFIPELNAKYGVYSGEVVKLSSGVDASRITSKMIYETKNNVGDVIGWNIHNICAGMFGSKSID